ncbi:MAG: hypothetical protein QM757_21450 [Paludibaculum sp.]
MNRRQLFQSTAAAAAAAVPMPAATVPLQKQIRITNLETDLVTRPPGEAHYDAIHRLGIDQGNVILRIKTDAGITGWASSSFGMISGGPKVVRTILEEEVKPILLGMDPAFPAQDPC